MKTGLILLLSILIGIGTSSAQWPKAENTYALDPGKELMVGIAADAFFGSDAITNRMAEDYIMHRFITDEVKSNVEMKLSDFGRIGAFFNGRLDFSFRPDSCNWTYIGTIQHHYFLESRFSSDLFSLYFRGNKDFADETAWVGSSELNSILYYQVGGGVAGRSKNDKLNWYAIGSVYFGHELLDIKVGEFSTLYTASDGSYLDADLDVRFILSDSTNTKSMAVNGTGAGISGGISRYFSEDWLLSASITNLGFISFSDKTADAAIDTTFRFEGIDVRELFSFNDSIRVFENDSSYVEAYFTNRKEKRNTRMVPGNMDFNLEKRFKDPSYSATIGSRFYLTRLATPLIWMEGAKRIGPHTIKARARYGGFAGLNFGLGYGLQLKGWKLEAGSDVLSSWMNMKQGTAMGAFVSLSKTY